MNHISRTAIAVVAIALVIVIGLIVLTADTRKEVVENTTPEPTAQQQTPSPEPTAQLIEPPAQEAQDDAQQVGEMYEGALAGLTEEEIGRLAMAEEQNHGDAAGDETAEEEGESVEAVAGVAD